MDKLKMHSPDLTADNIAKLASALGVPAYRLLVPPAD